MKSQEPVTIRRECEAVLIPSGETVRLARGSSAWITQALGGGFTLMTDRGHMVRIEAKDADALGMTVPVEPQADTRPAPESREWVEQRVWEQLRSCYDPEIPVNIVDLGLIYHCAVKEADGGFCAEVRFTLTAQGCGMGQFLKREIETKLAAVPGVRHVDVELVWDPPWSQSRISESARQQLGMA